MHTLKGDFIEIKISRLLRLRIVISNVRLWFAKIIVPHGWTIIDEADVSYFLHLKDLVKEQKAEGND